MTTQFGSSNIVLGAEPVTPETEVETPIKVYGEVEQVAQEPLQVPPVQETVVEPTRAPEPEKQIEQPKAVTKPDPLPYTLMSDVQPEIELPTKAPTVEEVVTEKAEELPKDKFSKVVNFHSPFTVRELTPDEEYVALNVPSDTYRNMNATVEGIDDEWYTAKETERYLRQIGAGLSLLTNFPHSEATLDETRTFDFDPKYKNTNFKPTRSNTRNVDNSNLSSKDASSIIRSKMNYGIGTNWGAFASGYWFTVNAPTGDRIRQMFHAIGSNKAFMGTALSGMGFTAERVYVDREVVNLFIDCLKSTTLTNSNDIIEKTKISDIDYMAAALAAAIYPNGFPYARTIINSNDTTGASAREVKGILSINRMQAIDWNSFSEKQKDLLSNRSKNSTTDELLEEYQNGFVNRPNTRSVIMDENVGQRETTTLYFDLEVPTIGKYFRMTDRWITDAMIEADQVLGTEPDENVRANYLAKKVSATELGKFVHWIKEIRVVEKDNETGEERETIVKEEDAIYQTALSLSGEGEVLDKFFVEIRKFINESTVAVIAIPTANDDEEENMTLPHMPAVFPIDAVMTFFMMASAKDQKL